MERLITGDHLSRSFVDFCHVRLFFRFCMYLRMYPAWHVLPSVNPFSCEQVSYQMQNDQSNVPVFIFASRFLNIVVNKLGAVLQI